MVINLLGNGSVRKFLAFFEKRRYKTVIDAFLLLLNFFSFFILLVG
jgi:hypothetical protein